MEEKKKAKRKTIPLILDSVPQETKPVVEKKNEPVGMFEIERAMKDLGSKLKDPKTRKAAEKEIEILHERMRNSKKHQKW